MEKAVTHEEVACRKKYDSTDSKRRLMKAALNTFSKLGYDATTTKVIAKTAGINESLIHRYFTNKIGLFFAVLHDNYRAVNNDLSYPVSDTLKEEIANFMHYRQNFCHEKRKFMKLLITRAIVDPKVRNEMGGLHRTGVPGLVERLKKFRENGQLRQDVNLEHLSILISGITFSMAMFTQVISTLDSKFADSVIELSIDLLSKALTP